MKKIVILDGYAENPGDLSWDGFRALGQVTVYDRTPAEQVVERLAGAEIAIINKVVMSEEVLARCPSLEYIGLCATGYNVVDTAATRRRGITVTNIPSYCAQAVAQFTAALLLEACHRVGEHNRSVKNGDWTRCADFCYWKYPLVELTGKTFGLIGLGRIGRATAKIAQALGLKTIAYSRSYKESADGIEAVSLDELYERSDVVSLHCPLNAQSENLIDAQAVARMKQGVIVLNTSRGGLIDEAAVADGLQTGRIAVYAADVAKVEPIQADNPLLACDNAILTPHIAWAPIESRARLMDTAVDNLRAYLAGRPQNVVG